MEQEIHQRRMKEALALAKQAARLGEVPVGAVIYRGEELVSVGFNKREREKNGLAHAELLAIERACHRLGGWRLHQCAIYVTLEPCVMCAGAIINTRIPLIVYGASDPKSGSFGSLLDIRDYRFNHHPQVISGVCEEESKALLRRFFEELRKR